MRFKQVQKRKKIFWGYGHFKKNAFSFYKDLPLIFHEQKALYGCHHRRDATLFSNKEICIDRKLFFSGRNGSRNLLERL